MSTQKTTDIIVAFLKSLKVNFARDLTDRYNVAMEIQANVDPTLGAPVYRDGKLIKNCWTLDHPEFETCDYYPIRIPRDAMGINARPSYNDRPLGYPFAYVVESIGMTGWNWVNEQSMWVGFDFDAIAGHAAGIGLSDNQLMEVKQKAQQIPWVQVRRSTGGSGLHLYVYFDPEHLPSTENHSVHSAAARAVLGVMSREVGFDFAPHLDVCGGNMWVWSRRITEENRGLEILKDNTEVFPGLPPNWRDNLDVIKGSKTKIRIQGIHDKDWEPFEAASSSWKKVEITEEHLEIEQRITELGYSIMWVPDHNCWQTHTKAFEDLQEKYPGAYKGLFQTLSEGNDPGKPNCFAFLMKNGALRITRFQRGQKEHETWQQDGQDWTWTIFNVTPDLRTASKMMGGVQDTDTNKWFFKDFNDVAKVVDLTGGSIDVDEHWLNVYNQNRQFSVTTNKSNKIVLEMTASTSETAPEGWFKKGRKFLRVLDTVETAVQDSEFNDYDGIVRSMVSPNGIVTGWSVFDDSRNWVSMDKSNVKSVLTSLEIGEIEKVLGGLLRTSWRLVNLPFQPEYPGDRQWNREAAQLRYNPGEPGPHPHWDMILEHCGSDLDTVVLEDDWCKEYGVTSGGQYLQLWIASMFKHPFDPLPYLFMYGPQNSGKSILHESISLLMTGGVVLADEALKNRSGFNGELANAILCVVEETDLSRSKEAYNRLKAWVTGVEIRIRPMYQQVYQQKNTTHWLQCANSSHEIVMFPGDTRIIMVWVPKPKKEIPKEILKQALIDEAPQFMRTLMDSRIPPAPGRLRLPVLMTDSKREAEDAAKTALEKFINAKCYYVEGSLVKFSDFYDTFKETVESDQKYQWPKKRVSNEIRERNLLPIGKLGANVLHVGNVSLEKPNPDEKFGDRWIVTGGKLRREVSNDE